MWMQKCVRKKCFSDKKNCGVQPCAKEVNFGVALRILSLHWLSFISKFFKVELYIELLDNFVPLISHSRKPCNNYLKIK